MIFSPQRHHFRSSILCLLIPTLVSVYVSGGGGLCELCVFMFLSAARVSSVNVAPSTSHPLTRA